MTTFDHIDADAADAMRERIERKLRRIDADAAAAFGPQLHPGPTRANGKAPEVRSVGGEFTDLDLDLDGVGRFALPLDEFIAAKSVAPAALIGTDDEILVPHAGLAILYARGGKGKTTLTIDAAFHFASG